LVLNREVLVARQRVEAGTVIEPGMLELEVRDVGFPAPPPPADPGSLAGWRARRDLEAGETVRTRDLFPPAAVRAGERVFLIAQSESARVTVEARALTAGRIGDRVILQSGWNGRRIEARIIAPGRALAERIAR
jgi:flagella basal body P-ring formation protein FlgA